MNDEFAESVRDHHRRNAELVQRLEWTGVDLETPRLIEHHFWAAVQGQCAALARELERRGFIVLVLARVERPGDERELWNVEAGIEQRIHDAVSEAVVSAMVEIARQFGAVYDGWGTRLGSPG